MKINRVFIKNFCSIKNELVCFQNPLYPLVLVGMNNVGKTNILRALNLFFENNSRDLVKDVFYEDSKDVEIVIEFKELNDWEKSQISEKNLIDEHLYVRQIGLCRPPAGGKKLKYHALRKKSDGDEEDGEEFKLQNYVSSGNINLFNDDFTTETDFYWFANPSGSSNFLEGYLPKFLYVPAVDDVDDELKVQTNTFFGAIISEIVKKLEGQNKIVGKIKEGLSELSGLQEISELNENLTKELKNIFSDVKFKFEISSPDFFKIIQQYANTVISDEVATSPKLKGEGVQRAVIFAIFKVYAEILIKSDIGRERSLIFAIEEPELFLHPQTQKVFLNALKIIARGGETDDPAKSDQVIFTTHSPNLVEVKDYVSICLIRKQGKETRVSQVLEDIFDENQEKKEEFRLIVEFDPERNELFFARKVMLVEGDTEKVCFRVIAEKMGSDLYKTGVSIIECGGKDKIMPFIHILNRFKIPFLVVCDQDPIEEDGDLDTISCEHCKERAKSKKESQKRKFALNQQMQDKIDNSFGKLEIMEPDFEGLCESEHIGSGLSKPFTAFTTFNQMTKAQIPTKLKNIVEELCQQ